MHHKKLTNAEKIAYHVAENGREHINIHRIPNTQMWLYAQYDKNTTRWKLAVCNPDSTTHRLVTEDPVTTEEYTQLWTDLIKAQMSQRNSATASALAKEYRKITTNINNKNQPYALPQNSRRDKARSTRHATHGKTQQVGIQKGRSRKTNGRG
jgi:hypothetical protein